MSPERDSQFEQQVPPLQQLPTWKLEDAKARLSEVIRLAKGTEPQKITVRGKDAVVVISAKLFEQIEPLLAQPSLHELLSESPLSKLDFEPARIQSPVRDVEV